MKKSRKMQILFFALIPVGILLLVFSIRMVRKSFGGPIITEIPFEQRTGAFTVEKPGRYAIWHKGPYWRKAPLGEFRPVVTNDSTGETPYLVPSVFRPNTNDGRTARMELFRFTAIPGKYHIELGEGRSISGVEEALIDLIPAKKAEPGSYFIQVRESQPFILMIFGILLICVSAFAIIGGLVIGILAPQIFKS